MKKLFLLLALSLNTSWAIEAVEPKRVVIFEEEDCLDKKAEEKCYTFLFSYDKSGIDFVDKILLNSIIPDDYDTDKKVEVKDDNEAKSFIILQIEKIKKELDEFGTGSSFINTNDFLGQRGKFLQYGLGWEIYMPGAAHGNASETYYIFDLENKQRLHLKDIVIEGKTQDLEKLLEKAVADYILLNENYNLDSMEDYKNCLNKEQTNTAECARKVLLFEAHPFAENIFETADNFYFDKDGIKFIFPPYTIAAYAVGNLEAKIKWKDLKGIIKDEYLP